MTSGRETSSQRRVKGVGVCDQLFLRGRPGRALRLGVAATDLEGEELEGVGRGVGCERVDTIVTGGAELRTRSIRYVVRRSSIIAARR